MLTKLRNGLERRAEPEKLSFGRIFALQAVLLFAVYGIMLIPHFSTDGYSVYFYTEAGDSLNGFLSLGRLGTFLLYKVLLALGINSVTMSPLFTAVFCLTAAWSAAMVLSLLRPYFSGANWLALVAVELAVMLAYANIYVAELFIFSDVALMYTFNIFFMTLALCLFFHRNRLVGVVLSLVCLSCSLSFYQASLGMFMLLGSALVLVRHDVLWTRPEGRGVPPLLRDLLCLLVPGGGASAVNVLTMNWLALAGLYTDRSPSLNLADIMDSVWQTITQFAYYYSWGYPDYLTGVLKIIFIAAGPILLFMLADSFDRNGGEHYPLASVVVTLLTLISGFLLVFVPHFLSRNVWVTPRSIFSFFAIFSLAAIITGYNYTRAGKSVPYPMLAVLLVLLVANAVVIQFIGLDQVKVNRLDKREAEEIIGCIQRYEEESGQTVDTISWRSDGFYTETHPEVKYVFMDMNIRAGGRRWSLIDCISYYAGHRFPTTYMPDEIWAVNFEGQEWDSFVPEEQIQFEGSTMYLMVY